MAYDPSSFNVAPTTITPGAGFDTLQWTNPALSTLTWRSNVTGIQTGQIATVDQGGSVSFTSTLGNGTANFGPADIGADQIISLSPATQTLGSNYGGGYPGAAFTLTLRNPTSAPVTYNLTFAGAEQSWLPAFPASPFPSTAAVPAQGTLSLPINLSPPLTMSPATYPFEVIANAAGIYGSVGGTIIVNNTTQFTTNPPGPGTPEPVSTSEVAIQITPATGSAGRGGTANFQVQLTNVGPATDTFSLSGFGNPATGHATITFGNPIPTIVPGQTYTDSLSVQVPANAPVGPFTIGICPLSEPLMGVPLWLRLRSTAPVPGVALTLSPQERSLSGTGDSAHHHEHRYGFRHLQSSRSPGPGASPTVALPQTSVTLAAGASQVLNVGIGNPPFATAGNLPFSIAAQSATVSTSAANLSSFISVPFSLSVAAAFQPASQNVPGSGAAVFPLIVQNTGSMAQDGYTPPRSPAPPDI